MSLVKKMPTGTPSTDSLASIPDDLLGPIPAEIRLGANVLMVMERPPEVRDIITVTMRLRVKDEGKGEAGEGSEELVHYRRCKIVAAWLKGDPEPPNPEDEQPALIATDGTINEDEDEGDSPDNVVRPPFSDESK